MYSKNCFTNLLTSLIKIASTTNDARWLSDSHDHILVYAKNKEVWTPNLLPRTEEQLKDYNNRDNNPRGVWRASDLSVRTMNKSTLYEITGPTGKKFSPPPTRAWGVSKERFKELDEDNRIWWGVNKDARPMLKKFITDVKAGITPETWWDRDFADDNKVAKYESKKIFINTSFATPKPEKLLQRILHIGSDKNDIVLDFFMGSATTQAVAHKMNRRYIGIEQMDYIDTVSVP